MDPSIFCKQLHGIVPSLKHDIIPPFSNFNNSCLRHINIGSSLTEGTKSFNQQSTFSNVDFSSITAFCGTTTFNNFGVNHPHTFQVDKLEQVNSLQNIGSLTGRDNRINPQFNCMNNNNGSNDKPIKASTNENNEKSSNEVDKGKAKVTLYLWCIEKNSKINCTEAHSVYYYGRKIVDGKIDVSINYKDVLKKFPGIHWLNVTHKQDTNGEKLKSEDFSIEEKGNEVSMSIKTNRECESTIYLSFWNNEKSEKFFSISLKLRCPRWKSVEKNKEVKMKIINGFIEKDQNISEVAQRALISEFVTEEEEIKKKKYNCIEKHGKEVLKLFLEKHEKETYEKFRVILLNLYEKKEDLKILCFDSLYRLILNIENNNTEVINYINYFKQPKYVQFLKEYSYTFGKSYENDIIITEDLKEKSNKRKRDTNPEAEEPQKRKKQTFDRDRNIIVRT